MPDPLIDECVPLGRWVALSERLPPTRWIGEGRPVLLGNFRHERVVGEWSWEAPIRVGSGMELLEPHHYSHWLAIPWPLPGMGSAEVFSDLSPDESLGASPSPTRSSVPSSSPAPSPLFPSWGSPPVCPSDPPRAAPEFIFSWDPALRLRGTPLVFPADPLEEDPALTPTGDREFLPAVAITLHWLPPVLPASWSLDRSSLPASPAKED